MKKYVDHVATSGSEAENVQGGYHPKLFTNRQQTSCPQAHVLMPLFNADRFIINAVQSVLAQNYSDVVLLIYDDGSSDTSAEIIRKLVQDDPLLGNKIRLESSTANKGVAYSRQFLINWSKRLNQNAYIFWLDADDKYTRQDFITSVIEKMLKTKADICLINFSIVFEDEKQRNNAALLMPEKKKVSEIITKILEKPTQAINPIDMADLLEFTSLGWTKCYAPTVDFPTPADCPFEDFVFMSTLLQSNCITALPADIEPIEYLRRSTSICGQRSHKSFVEDIPTQLTCFFNTVLSDTKNQPEQLQKLKMAQNFVLRKLNQYRTHLEKIISEKTHPSVNAETFEAFKQKADALEKLIQDTVHLIEESEAQQKIQSTDNLNQHCFY